MIVVTNKHNHKLSSILHILVINSYFLQMHLLSIVINHCLSLSHQFDYCTSPNLSLRHIKLVCEFYVTLFSLLYLIFMCFLQRKKLEEARRKNSKKDNISIHNSMNNAILYTDGKYTNMFWLKKNRKRRGNRRKSNAKEPKSGLVWKRPPRPKKPRKVSWPLRERRNLG